MYSNLKVAICSALACNVGIVKNPQENEGLISITVQSQSFKLMMNWPCREANLVQQQL